MGIREVASSCATCMRTDRRKKSIIPPDRYTLKLRNLRSEMPRLSNRKDERVHRHTRIYCPYRCPYRCSNRCPYRYTDAHTDRLLTLHTHLSRYCDMERWALDMVRPRVPTFFTGQSASSSSSVMVS